MNSNEYMRKYVAARYIRLKKLAVDYMGGKCQKCGYDKCIAALEFHHKNPTEKEFDWNKLRKQSWGSVIVELNKCELLCSCCHKEAHYDQSIYDEAIEYLESMKRKTTKIEKVCLCCGMKFNGYNNRKFCSHDCATKNRYKIEWPSNLYELVQKSSKRAVALKLGVSDKAVAKRLKSLSN